MNLSLSMSVQKLIDERVKSGKYATPEDVVAAAIQQEQFADFEPGELDGLLVEGEQSIEQGTLDGDKAFRMRRARPRDQAR
jgi:Arc/MetJ-type ribon-helix-helix transcriptional regulator